MPAKRKSLGQAELDVLQYIGDNHPISVGDVARHIAETKGLARTTVQTVMERLRVKGYLTRKRVDGVNQYSPKLSKPDLMTGLVGDFVNGVLGGSVSPFVAYLNDQKELSDEELESLKHAVEELETRKRNPS